MASTIRGTLVGCGYFAQNHLHAWRDLGVEIAAVCDIDPMKAADTAARHGIARHYTDAGEMLRRERPDFVDIATTVATHRSLVELAAAEGVPAICQKPFAETLSDADAMVAACEAAGIPLMIHENFRWRRPMLEARRQIDKGSIGTPFFARISCRHDFDVYAGQPYLAQVKRFAILDVGIHLLDLARFYLGEVDDLACTTQRANPRVEGEDTATLLLRHRNGTTSIVDMSFFTHVRPQQFPQTTLEIDGHEGSLRVDSGYRMAVTRGEQLSTTSVEPPVPAWGAKPWHDVQHSVLNIQRHWLDVLRTGIAPATSGRDNRETLRLALLAYDAAATGQTVAVRSSDQLFSASSRER